MSHPNKHPGNHNLRTREEYETQFFGSSSTEYSKEVSHIFVESIKSGFEGLSNYMCHIKAKQSPENKASDEDVAKIKAVTDTCFEEFISTISQRLQCLEEYVCKKYFNIPDHVVLTEDQIQTKLTDPSETARLDEEINSMLNRLAALKYQESVLTAELEVGQNTIPKIQQLVEKSENLALQLKQLPDLQQLVTSTKEIQVEANEMLGPVAVPPDAREWSDSD
ncbi:hypothetical protein B566_EDAN004411 [Ephemera danica]|nr:hypothetical protein B566_EDAN004411 [Ephemera danica]